MNDERDTMPPRRLNARPLIRGDFIESSQLFANGSEVQIFHDGEVYRLRLTKNGKLILNK